MQSGWFFLLVLTIFFSCCSTAKIAVFNDFFAHSHFAYLSKLADVLTDNGHDVTVISAEIDPNMKIPFPQKAKMLIRAEPPVGGVVAHDDELEQPTYWEEKYDFWNDWNIMHGFMKLMTDQCERYLNDSQFAAKLVNEKFDLALLEPANFCAYGMIKLAKIPVYVNSVPMALSGVHARELGLDGSSLESFPVSSQYHPGLSFIDRVWDMMLPFYITCIKRWDIRTLCVDQVRQYADPNFTPAKAITDGRYLFLNTEEHIDFPRPVTHKVVYIGGITVADSRSKPLSDEYKTIFDNAKKGVIIVSFGSLSKSSYMPQYLKAAFLKLFAAFPEISFIWKYENKTHTIANDLPNVYKKTWIPQTDLIAHPKLLTFITHGGMNSVLESAFAGVPLLGIPLFADQARNLRMLEHRETSIVIYKEAVTAEKLISAIYKLTDTNKYQKRARELAILVKSNPQSAKDRFLSHIDHAIKFSTTKDYLNIGHREFGFFKYYNFDVYAFIILSLTFILGFIGFVFLSLFKLPFILLKKRTVSVTKKGN